MSSAKSEDIRKCTKITCIFITYNEHEGNDIKSTSEYLLYSLKKMKSFVNTSQNMYRIFIRKLQNANTDNFGAMII